MVSPPNAIKFVEDVRARISGSMQKRKNSANPAGDLRIDGKRSSIGKIKSQELPVTDDCKNANFGSTFLSSKSKQVRDFSQRRSTLEPRGISFLSNRKEASSLGGQSNAVVGKRKTSGSQLSGTLQDTSVANKTTNIYLKKCNINVGDSPGSGLVIPNSSAKKRVCLKIETSEESTPKAASKKQKQTSRPVAGLGKLFSEDHTNLLNARLTSILSRNSVRAD